MKEILLYFSIYSYSAADFITELEAAKGAGVTLRINSNGGDPDSTWGMIAKWQEYKGTKKVKVDGKAHSMALYFLCYVTDAECLPMTTFILHRAAYSEWIESDPQMMTADRWDSLKRVNDILRAAFEAKVDVAKFEKLKGVTLDQVFSTPGRIDVEITAQEALAIGLIDRIITIDAGKKAEIEASFRMAAEKRPDIMQLDMPELKIAAETTPPTTSKIKNMTLSELKANHPEVYAQAVNEGATQERDRVGALMAYVDVDPETVTAMVKEGKAITQTLMAEFSRKAFSKDALKQVEGDSAKPVVTGEANPGEEKTAEQVQVDAWKKEVKAGLKW